MRERTEYDKEYDKERYEWLKEHHICVRCRKEKAESGRVYCLLCKMDKREIERKRTLTEHQKERNRVHKKQRYDILVAFGICPRCGKNEHKYSSIFCGKCASIRNNKAMNKRRQKRNNCKSFIWNRRILFNLWKNNRVSDRNNAIDV